MNLSGWDRRKVPSPLSFDHLLEEEAAMLSEELESAYHRFYDAANCNTVLSAKTTLLIQMAAAMAFGCYP